MSPPNDAPDFLAATDVAPIPVGSVLILRNFTSGNAGFQLPATTTGLFLLVRAIAQQMQITVTGGVTGLSYLNIATTPGNPALLGVPIASALDNPITITCSVASVISTINDTDCVDVLAITGAGFAQIWNNVNDALWVQALGSSTFPTAPQEVGTMKSVLVSAAMAANGTSTPVAGAVGKTIWVYGYDISVGPSTLATTGTYDVTLGDSHGIVAGRVRIKWATASGQAAYPWRACPLPAPLPLTSGDGLVLTAGSGNAGSVDCLGVIYYTQH